MSDANFDRNTKRIQITGIALAILAVFFLSLGVWSTVALHNVQKTTEKAFIACVDQCQGNCPCITQCPRPEDLKIIITCVGTTGRTNK